MIFPVGFATIFAVLMGNMLNHGLYHSLVDVRGPKDIYTHDI